MVSYKINEFSYSLILHRNISFLALYDSLKNGLSAKLFFNNAASAFFIPANILLIAIFTESSAVCDLAVE